MKQILIVISIVLYVGIVYAGGPGTKGGIAFRFPIGAREIGGGEAFVAATDDVNAIYWNPAGLVYIESKEFTTYYLDGLVDTSYTFIGYAQSIQPGAIGCGISMLDGGKATIYYPEGTIKKVTAQRDYLFILSYANKMKENLSVGGNLKMIQSELGEISKATGFACDVGGLYSIPGSKLRIGVVIQNIGTKIKYEQEGDSLPLNLKVGIAYRLNNLLLALDINKPIEDKLRVNIGTEYWVAELIALRAGYKFRQGKKASGTGLTAGAGFKISNYQLDYAYVPNSDLGNTHRISALVRF